MSLAQDPAGSSLTPTAVAGNSGARAERIAASVTGITLGRRLAAFRDSPGRVPAARPASAARPLAERLAAAVDGVIIDGRSGRIVRVDAGSLPLALDRERLSWIPGQPAPDQPLVCLDTETTGLGTGTGTVAFLVGIARWEAGTLRLVQLLLPDHGDEAALLDAVAAEIGTTPALVTYNGRTFDWPLLVARFRLHGRAAPSLAAHVDLLTTVRRLFRHRLDRARLRSAEEGLLDLRRFDDVEGWEIPSLYFDFLRGGPADPLARVVRHNAEDVRSLGRLLAYVDRTLADPHARPSAHPGDQASLAGLLRAHGRHDDSLACLDGAIGALRHAPHAGVASDPLGALLSARARTLRRLGRPDDARAAWEEAALVEGPDGAAAWVEVAKILEHAERDVQGALRATDRALALLARRRALGRPDPRAEGLLHGRRARLVRRIERSRGAARPRTR